ncbi:Gamma-glutamyltranspeptidase precursor [Thalassovita gelatinovora]|uniref:Gamma-glutamyltranspeptidase n=1 Tax=Thalassovita gelatinovora TaxID=53501 RepID=A0A0P1G8M8_THAGE|nr:gamma-glutamyltransferase [Thalassovita gelatinovora]QIZ82310.1 hypothetical protein HFZ77_18420 [Thalassovita gelatinovora]CUH68355.1 Gamma-glutamyltranspeptidase precursor [Thalassovita gelatinovora]SER19410.1 gamma-glutamyltranspeptidase / glutathione hydrolase [Thalassovita gelatinovora]
MTEMNDKAGRGIHAGVVAAGSPYAAEAGAEILRKGGSAADAAVAATLAICVSDPANASLLGRAQILVRGSNGAFAAIDGASAAPSSIPLPPDIAGEMTGLACAGIPGLPQALGQLHRRFGRLPLGEVASPAIKLAEQGFRPPEHLSAVWALRADQLAANQAMTYSRPGDGMDFRHPRLGALLRDFANNGAAAITQGETARQLVAGVRDNGGYWTPADLAGNDAREGELLHGRFRDCTVSTIGRQGWGHSLIQMLMILDQFPAFGSNMTADEALRLILTIRTCFADRPQRLGTLEPKPDGLALEMLVSPDFVASRAEAIRKELSQPANMVQHRAGTEPECVVEEDQDTTHLSTLDASGASVALTCSIGPHFGLRCIEPTFGLLPAKSYRMETDPAPGLRDVTEMAPVIVSRNGHPILTIGAAGSERIPGAIVQVIANVIDRGLDLQEAVARPRVNLKDDRPRVHRDIGTEVIAELTARGFSPELSERGHLNHLGIVHAVGVDASGQMTGAADDAWDGTVAFA